MQPPWQQISTCSNCGGVLEETPGGGLGCMNIKCAAVAILTALAFASQAFAVLRPLFPVKPAVPFNGEVIVIGDDFVLRSAKKPLLHHRVQAQ